MPCLISFVNKKNLLPFGKVPGVGQNAYGGCLTEALHHLTLKESN
jgi:hypothetical protein